MQIPNILPEGVVVVVGSVAVDAAVDAVASADKQGRIEREE